LISESAPYALKVVIKARGPLSGIFMMRNVRFRLRMSMDMRIGCVWLDALHCAFFLLNACLSTETWPRSNRAAKSVISNTVIGRYNSIGG
jgi:hypothetical protein